MISFSVYVISTVWEISQILFYEIPRRSALSG